MILVGCPVATFSMEGGHWHHWLENAVEVTRAAEEAGQKVRWHAVLHKDRRGEAPFVPLKARLMTLRETFGIRAGWSSFQANLGDVEIDEINRLPYICIGRNLVIEAALRNDEVAWIWNVDCDISYPDNVLPKLLECEYPVVGCRVPQAGIFGPRATPATIDQALDHPIDARWHWNSAGALLVHREVFERVPWRWRPSKVSRVESDDYATAMAMEEIGYPTLVRHDVVAQHQPVDPNLPWGLPAYKERGLDTTVRQEC